MPGPEGTYWITKRNKRQVSHIVYCTHLNWIETELEASETGNVCAYVCVCMFTIGACTVRATGLKFDTEVGFHSKSIFG